MRQSFLARPFLLLHSLSHHVMHGIARFSGLDLGSMKARRVERLLGLPLPSCQSAASNRVMRLRRR